MCVPTISQRVTDTYDNNGGGYRRLFTNKRETRKSCRYYIDLCVCKLCVSILTILYTLPSFLLLSRSERTKTTFVEPLNPLAYTSHSMNFTLAF